MAAPEPGPSWGVFPDEWQAEINYTLWNDRYTPDDAIAAHHGGAADYRAGKPPYSVSQEAAQFRSWERYHLSKGWRGIAYGWGVGMTGTLFNARMWGTYGAHRGDLDGDGISNNVEVIPFIIIGSGNHHIITPEADRTIRRLRAYVEAESGRSLRLYGHQELRGTVTECPGPNFMDYVRVNRILEDEMVDRKTKADDGNPDLMPNHNEFVERGIYSKYTQPGGVAFYDEIATIMKRWEDDLLSKISAQTGTTDSVARRATARVSERVDKITQYLRNAGSQ